MAKRTEVAVTDLARAYPQEQYSVMVVQQDLTPHEHVRHELVAVRVDPLQTKRGDVHVIDGGYYLAKNAVDRVAVALGVIFDPDRTRVEKDGAFVWVGRCVAAWRNPHGVWIIRTGEYEWDAELRAKIDAKGDERKEARLVLEYAKHGRSRAETGAKSRVIRALTGLKTSYSKEELMKPLVFVRHEILPTAPAHMQLTGQAVWSAPQQVTALPDMVEGIEDDDDTIAGEAEELPDDGDGEDAGNGAAPAAAAAAEPVQQVELPDDDPPDDDMNVDPLGEAALMLGIATVPEDKHAAPHTYRLLELYAEPRCEPLRQDIARKLDKPVTEDGAATMVRRIENYFKDSA